MPRLRKERTDLGDTRVHGLERSAVAAVVEAEFDDADVGIRVDCRVEAAQRVLGGVAADAGVLHHDVIALGAQALLQLRRIGLLARQQPAEGEAVAEGDDVDGRGGGGGREQKKRENSRKQPLHKQPHQLSTPTIAPVMQVAKTPDTIDLPPSEMMSLRRSGAMTVRPASMMPSEAKLAKPQMA